MNTKQPRDYRPGVDDPLNPELAKKVLGVKRDITDRLAPNEVFALIWALLYEITDHVPQQALSCLLHMATDVNFFLMDERGATTGADYAEGGEVSPPRAVATAQDRKATADTVAPGASHDAELDERLQWAQVEILSRFDPEEAQFLLVALAYQISGDRLGSAWYLLSLAHDLLSREQAGETPPTTAPEPGQAH